MALPEAFHMSLLSAILLRLLNALEDLSALFLLPYQFGILDLAVASIGCVRCCTVRESSQRALFQKRKYLANGTAVKVGVIWLYKHQLKIQSGLKRGVVI